MLLVTDTKLEENRDMKLVITRELLDKIDALYKFCVFDLDKGLRLFKEELDIKGVKVTRGNIKKALAGGIDIGRIPWAMAMIMYYEEHKITLGEQGKIDDLRLDENNSIKNPDNIYKMFVLVDFYMRSREEQRWIRLERSIRNN